jgi:hypothetical protein
MSPVRPRLDVAVIMQRVANTGVASRWQPWRWQLADVVPQEEGFGSTPRLLLESEHEVRWLHPGLQVELFKDDAEGCYLNVTTPAPSWFVLWTMEEEPRHGDEPIALPLAVSLSYHDAGRWMDGADTVEQVAAPAAVVQWLKDFTDEHYKPEPKKRKRPESMRALTDRFGNPASISTGKRYGDGSGGGHG